MNIVWADDAKACLKEIILYGVDNWGLKVANQFHDNLIKIEQRLALNPELGHPELLLAERTFIYRSILIQKNFKLIYRIVREKDSLLIVDIWDTRREPNRLKDRIR